jgi:hypothetical protein
MRACQFVTEATIGTLTIGGITIIVDEHAMDQAVERMVLPTDVDRVLRKLPSIKSQITQIESGQKFWVYDPELQVGLGCRMLNAERVRIQFKTVIGARQGSPNDGPVPVLSVE